MSLKDKSAMSLSAIERIRADLSKAGITFDNTVENKLAIKLKIPRFVPFDMQSLTIVSDTISGSLYFVLMLTFCLWEDVDASEPEEYHRRAEIVEWRLIPAVRDFFEILVENHELSLEVEFDDAVDISIEGQFQDNQWDILAGLVLGLLKKCNEWKGDEHSENSWTWVKRAR